MFVLHFEAKYFLKNRDEKSFCHLSEKPHGASGNVDEVNKCLLESKEN